MAMIDCPVCGKLYSDKIGKCRHCGYEYKKKKIVFSNKSVELAKKIKEDLDFINQEKKNLDWRNLVFPPGFYF